MTQGSDSGIRARVRVHVDEELSDLVPGFLDNRRRDVVTMRAALKNGDFEAIRTLGHSMKGAGGGYGFDSITEIGKAIEGSAGKMDAEAIIRHIDELADFLDSVEVVYDPQ